MGLSPDKVEKVAEGFRSTSIAYMATFMIDDIANLSNSHERYNTPSCSWKCAQVSYQITVGALCDTTVP